MNSTFSFYEAILGKNNSFKKATSLKTEKGFICGAPLLQSLQDAVKRFEDGEPIGEGFTVDEVEMTVLDDWEEVGYMYMQDGEGKCMYAPLISVNGVTDRLLGDDEIEGIKLFRGHEYRIKVRRIFLTNHPFYHHYKMRELISDIITQQ